MTRRRLFLSPLLLLVALLTGLGLNTSSAAASAGPETRVRAAATVPAISVGQPSSENPGSVGCLRPETGHVMSGSCVATKAVPSASEAADLVRGANPVGSALKSDAAHRSASFVVDDIASNGTVFRTVGGDGVTRTLVQAPGELNGVAGRFEWIVDDAGNLTHQMFVKGGSISGVPIKP